MIMARKRVKLYYAEPLEQFVKVQKRMVNGTEPRLLPVKMAKSKTNDGITDAKCKSNLKSSQIHVPCISHNINKITIDNLFGFISKSNYSSIQRHTLQN